jgi:CubicO group peptidase (beta-lactamase class C family)
MTRLALALLALTMLALTTANADPIDDIMARAMAQAHIAGAAVAVVRDGKIERIATYGSANVEDAAPVTPTTPFQLASSSKLYTAVLLMRMVEQRRLGLDDPVTRYLPDAPASWNGVTIRDLATHTSGLASPDVGRSVTAAADAVRSAYPLPRKAAPGTVVDYGAFDYPVLQVILERVGGKPFAQLLHDEVFVPAGMTCTAFDGAEDRGPQRVANLIPGRAEYYRWVEGARQRRWFLYTQWAYAAGGAYSCARDVATFLVALERGKLVSPASLAAMATPLQLPDGSTGTFAVGWEAGTYRGRRWMGHSGGPAFSDVMYFPDQRLGIVVLTNEQRLYPQFASLIADAYLPVGPAYLQSSYVDTDLALTNAARALFDAARRGAVDPNVFAPARRAAYVDDLDDLGPAWFGTLAPLSQVLLANDVTFADGTRERLYRVAFGDHVEAIRVDYDPAGKITGIDAHGD